MRSVSFALAFAVVAMACSKAPPGGGDGGGGGGGSGAADMTMVGPPDLSPRPIAGIACGVNTCTTNLELCCTSDNGATGVCQQIQNSSCGSSVFLCDGSEDCPPAMPECCVVGGYATCGQPGTCASKQNARVMCHDTSECQPGEQCLGAPSSPYSLCLTPSP
jgi:hypothetical protein